MDERTRLGQLAPVEYYYLTEPSVKRTREGNGAGRDWKGDLGAQVCTKTAGIECHAHFKQKTTSVRSRNTNRTRSRSRSITLPPRCL